MSARAWGRLLRRDAVDRPFRGVGVLRGAPDPSLTRAHAALAAVRCDVALTGWSAAHALGLIEAAPTDVHLLMAHGASVARRPGLRLTETSVMPDTTRTRDGLPVVAASRMLADLAPTTTVDGMLDLAIDARFAGHLDPGSLDAEVAARRRFPGRPRLRALADGLREDASDSGFELAARARLGDRGLPPDAGQHVVRLAGRERRIDLPYAAHGVGVECLGLAAHSGRARFDADADRRNDFAEDGSWLVLELTWTTFHRHWDAFAERLERVLARRSPAA